MNVGIVTDGNSSEQMNVGCRLESVKGNEGNIEIEWKEV